ncbi:uncharacterized protein LOC129584032 [Paramacrobiotus metropolitanus]|uniref:uncharacterized protein LOC129584032 n=1 Tax=Paramacrobiotus metropolitanus TaxID=2943436 RepID=UPI0024461CAC|nr:uncharacterized protein LOC129584032 [Paramacrobiotus metropolitanus]
MDQYIRVLDETDEILSVAELPEDLLIDVFQCLDSHEHLVLKRVCRAWEYLLNSGTFTTEIFINFSKPITGNAHFDQTTANNILKCMTFANVCRSTAQRLIILGPFRTDRAVLSPAEVQIQEMMFRNIHRAVRQSPDFWNPANRKGHFVLHLAGVAAPYFHLNMLVQNLLTRATCIRYRLEDVVVTNIFGENDSANGSRCWTDAGVVIARGGGRVQRRDEFIEQLADLIERDIAPVGVRELEMLKILVRGELLYGQQNARRTVLQTIKMFEPGLQKITAQQLASLNLTGLKKTTLRAVWDEVSKLNLIFHACG